MKAVLLIYNQSVSEQIKYILERLGDPPETRSGADERSEAAAQGDQARSLDPCRGMDGNHLRWLFHPHSRIAADDLRAGDGALGSFLADFLRCFLLCAGGPGARGSMSAHVSVLAFSGGDV